MSDAQKVPQIRWMQRLENYERALVHLEDAVALLKSRELSQLEKMGILKAFEFTFELSWNVMKDYLAYQGISDIIGSRGAFRTAFQNGIISDGQTWMDMIDDRNIIAHDYDERRTDEIILRMPLYASLFRQFANVATAWRP